MYINCFLVLMILSQNIFPPTETKPYFTRVHRLNSVRDFDDVVDWTENQNVNNQKQAPEGSKGTTSNIKQRSITSEAPYTSSYSAEEKKADGTTQFDKSEKVATEKIEVTKMPSPPSKEEIKEKKKRSEVEEIKDVIDENEDNIEEFGEGFSNLYKKVRDKMKKKKCKNCLTKLEDDVPMKFEDVDDLRSNLKYILPYRRSVPICLLNDRNAGGYLQPAAVPVVQPVLFKEPRPVFIQGTPNDRTAFYEVEWLDNSPVSALRKRRNINFDFYPKRAYPFVADRECEHSDKVTEIQNELINMIRAVKSEFLNRNNLTFIPILFAPHCGKQTCPEVPDPTELGHLTFQNVDSCKLPEKEKEDLECQCPPPQQKNPSLPPCPPQDKMNSSCINIGHMTIILVANNTLSVVFPSMNEVENAPSPCYCLPLPPQPPLPPPPEAIFSICPYPPPSAQPIAGPPPSPGPGKTIPYKRNVIDNLKQYLQDAFNFIDIRRVLTEEEIHDRRTRDTVKRFGNEIIPGILLYPKKYGASLAKCSRETSMADYSSIENPLDYYLLANTIKISPKYKRSLDSSINDVAHAEMEADKGQLDIEKKQVQLEKEMQSDLNLDKDVAEALNAGSSKGSSAIFDQLRKDESKLEQENEEVLNNEKLLETTDEDSSIETTSICNPADVITEDIEPISSATDSFIDSMGPQAAAVIEAGGKLEDLKETDIEELESTTKPPVECSECPEPEPCPIDGEPCPTPCPSASDDIVHQTHSYTSESKKSKSVAEFEDEMTGIVDDSKNSLATEEKRKGVFDITTKHSGKLKKKRKSKKNRSCWFYQRNRRDLKSTDISSTSPKMEVRAIESDVTELTKVTPKESTFPVVISEEVENDSDVLFTEKPGQEELELECNKLKGGEPTYKSTTQKLGEPVKIVITRSTEQVSTNTQLPSGLSEFVQPPLRDENDEAVTETLTRLLRDLRLASKVQNLLDNFEIQESVRKRIMRKTSDVAGFTTGRKLFSMEVHQKAAESKGPFQRFRKRTYRRRSGENFRRYSRGIIENRPVDVNFGETIKGNIDKEDPNDYLVGKKTSRNRRKWKNDRENWVEWVPKFEPFLEPNYQNYQF